MMASMPHAGPESPAPDWFVRAIAARPEHRSIQVAGATVRYRAWGDPTHPGLVLVHGGAAHSGWWDHIGPQLTSHRVIAPDLTGHGDSDRRESYGVDQWAEEINALIAAERLDRPVVVGHSMGGWVSVAAGGLPGSAIRAVAVLDSPLNDRPPEEAQLAQRQRPTRVYPRIEDALARFATIPPQDLVLPYVEAHIAPASLRQVEGGWTWKFDPKFFGQRGTLRNLLQDLACPAAMFRSENGLVSHEMTVEMGKLVGDDFAVVEVPAAGHHPMLDQPLALVTGLRTLLALWPDRLAR